MPQDGRKRFTGALAGVEDDKILLDCDGARLALAFATLTKAKLVLTDALIAEHQEAEAASAADASMPEEGKH